MESKIKDFPKEVIEKMLYYQEKQGNKRDVSVFERDPSATADFGGFDWCYTEEGEDFWYDVTSESFDVFFKRYPKNKLIDEIKEALKGLNVEIKQVGDVIEVTPRVDKYKVIKWLEEQDTIEAKEAIRLIYEHK